MNKIRRSYSPIPSLILLLFLSLQGFSSLSAQDHKMNAIEEVIQEAYLDGAYNEKVERNVRLGFSKEFKAYYWDEVAEELRTEVLTDWLKRIRKNPGRLGQSVPKNEVYRHKVISSKIYRSTAQVQLRIYRGGKVIGTRHCTLFKYPDGWKIALIVAPQKDSES